MGRRRGRDRCRPGPERLPHRDSPGGFPGLRRPGGRHHGWGGTDAAGQGAAVDRLPAGRSSRAAGYPLRLPLGVAALSDLHPMMRLLPPAHMLPGLATLAFATFLTLALVRLFLVDQDLRDNVDENMLWVISQAQVASHRLAGAVN